MECLLKPVNSRLVTRRVEVKKESHSFLIIPEDNGDMDGLHEVIAVPEKECGYEKGDIIIVGRYGYLKVKIEGQEFNLTKIDDILAKVNKTDISN